MRGVEVYDMGMINGERRGLTEGRSGIYDDSAWLAFGVAGQAGQGTAGHNSEQILINKSAHFKSHAKRWIEMPPRSIHHSITIH
jgi:hypothetical protein